MKLYTKRGDDGGTDLFGGQRVGKDDLRVQAYGSVDELNSVIGLATATCDFDDIRQKLQKIQRLLFDLGADLATPLESPCVAGKVIRIDSSQVVQLEGWIDQVCGNLPDMRYFILPGGSELAARLHLARTVCRRAERQVVALSHHEPIGSQVIVFINRLSDLLFALARLANQYVGIDDIPWRPAISN